MSLQYRPDLLSSKFYNGLPSNWPKIARSQKFMLFSNCLMPLKIFPLKIGRSCLEYYFRCIFNSNNASGYSNNESTFETKIWYGNFSKGLNDFHFAITSRTRLAKQPSGIFDQIFFTFFYLFRRKWALIRQIMSSNSDVLKHFFLIHYLTLSL